MTWLILWTRFVSWGEREIDDDNEDVDQFEDVKMYIVYLREKSQEVVKAVGLIALEMKTKWKTHQLFYCQTNIIKCHLSTKQNSLSWEL